MSDHLAANYADHLRQVRALFDEALTVDGFDGVVIASGSPHMQYLDDMPYPFKANPHFKYWLPLTRHPHCFIVYAPGAKPVLIYYQPVDFWHKAEDVPISFWTEQFEIKVIQQPEQAKALMPKSGRHAYLGEPRPPVENLVHDPKVLMDHLNYQRAYKSEYELACMREASLSGARGHVAAEQAFRAGASEFEIHAAFCEASVQTTDELPYAAIVALNSNGATLHYQMLERARPAHGNLHSFLIDAGAQHNGYASDITRSYSFEDTTFQALIDGMEREQQALCADVRAGTDFRELHLATHRAVAGLLVEFGLVKVSAEAAFERGITRTFLPHGLGHLLGLQVHDVGGTQARPEGGSIGRPEGHPFLRLTRTLEPEMVLTIEPGLYFITPLLAELRASPEGNDIDWERVDAMRRFGGIRIEDNVRVTDGEPENLTRDAFAALA